MTFKKADAQEEVFISLDCSHPGCKLPWSVDIGKKLCSFHQWGSAPKPRPEDRPTRFFTKEEKYSILRKFADVGSADPKAWAYALRDRDEAGDKITNHQRKAYEEVIGNKTARNQ
jgi:hypothetical protein